MTIRAKRVYEIDGDKFSTLEEFAGHFSETVLIDYAWTGGLDAFNDILRGGFGTPDEGFVLRWRNSEVSRQYLGYTETARQLRKRLSSCHPSNRQAVSDELELAEAGFGPTVYDWLLEIVREHGPGGGEPMDGVELELL